MCNTEYDGSKKWTPEWLQKLEHRFGGDGDFWISYDDPLRKYQAFERTRLFDSDWSVAQLWTMIAVPWILDYRETYFSLSLRLHTKGKGDYLARSQTPYGMRRSVNVEPELEAGKYDVRVEIDACRCEGVLPAEQVIRNSAKTRREEPTRIGLAYDPAHGKGKVVETPEEKDVKEAHNKRHDLKRRQETSKKLVASMNGRGAPSLSKEDMEYRKRIWRGIAREHNMQARKMAKLAATRAKQRAIELSVAGRRASLSTAGQSGAPDAVGERRTESEVEAGNHERPADASKGEDAVMHGVGEQLGHGHVEQFSESGSEPASGSSDDFAKLSQRELDIHVEMHIGAQKRMAAASLASAPRAPVMEEQPDEFERDPWNVVAVISLRVCHKVGEGGDADVVRLGAVRV